MKNYKCADERMKEMTKKLLKDVESGDDMLVVLREITNYFSDSYDATGCDDFKRAAFAIMNAYSEIENLEKNSSEK